MSEQDVKQPNAVDLDWQKHGFPCPLEEVPENVRESVRKMWAATIEMREARLRGEPWPKPKPMPERPPEPPSRPKPLPGFSDPKTFVINYNNARRRP